jgi:hypothetical protein
LDRLRSIYDHPLAKLILPLIVVIILAFIMDYVPGFIQKSYSQCDSMFYFFSASAQSIATFVAFLLMGYTLVLSIMDKFEEKDETLGEIHHSLKIGYYDKIRDLSILTGSAIIFNLLMIFSHKIEFPLKYQIITGTILLDVASVVLGISFVTVIINPNKYKKIAEQIIESKTDGFRITGEKVNKADFFVKFVELEILVRNLLDSVSAKMTATQQKPFLGFRQMSEILLYNELIGQDLYGKLLEVSRYRNLVFHGHLEEVDAGMVKMLEECLQQVGDIAPDVSRR